MSARRKVSEVVKVLSSAVLTDETGVSIANQERLVEREYFSGSKTRDYYCDFTVEKPGGGSYTWHASLHNSGKQNLDLITSKGTFHQHGLLDGELKKFKTSFWEKTNEK